MSRFLCVVEGIVHYATMLTEVSQYRHLVPSCLLYEKLESAAGASEPWPSTTDADERSIVSCMTCLSLWGVTGRSDA